MRGQDEAPKSQKSLDEGKWWGTVTVKGHRKEETKGGDIGCVSNAFSLENIHGVF